LNKAPDAFRTISEVADELDLPQHVLRFWESRFPHIKPLKRGGGRRYYRPEDIDLLRGIRRLLYADGYTIRGVQRILREQGVRTVQLVGQGQDVPVPPQDGGEDRRNGNGSQAGVNLLTPLPAPDDDGGGPEAYDAPARPQNGPIAEASVVASHPVAVAPVARLEAGPVDQAQVAVAAAPVAITLVAVAPVVAPPAMVPPATALPVAMPSPPNMAARDLDRLKQALAELEACRRLLDKAIEGGR
jgi:DNA-binding transcriptional MerR regulator